MELAILNNVVETLNDYDFGGINISVEKAKLDLSSYEAIGNVILVKILDLRPSSYLDRNMQITEAYKGNFVILESICRLIIISKDMFEQDEIFELTEILDGAMKAVPPTDTEGIEEFRFFFSGASEPMYEEEKQFSFRELTFVKPIIKYIGE